VIEHAETSLACASAARAGRPDQADGLGEIPGTGRPDDRDLRGRALEAAQRSAGSTAASARDTPNNIAKPTPSAERAPPDRQAPSDAYGAPQP